MSNLGALKEIVLRPVMNTLRGGKEVANGDEQNAVTSSEPDMTTACELNFAFCVGRVGSNK